MRRAVDVAGAGVLLVLASPIMLVVAVAIRLSMGRPVLFRQRRVGRDGRPFTIHKFRTMRHPRRPDETDPERITRLGTLLRRTSIDELPQLWDILRGEMSFIGPRPTLPEQVARYSPRERRRLTVRPGLTGYAQVNGRNALSWPERIELDIWYLENRSLLLDLRIVARTVWNIVRPVGLTGAGGVNPDFPGRGTRDALAEPEAQRAPTERSSEPSPRRGARPDPARSPGRAGRGRPSSG